MLLASVTVFDTKLTRTCKVLYEVTVDSENCFLATRNNAVTVAYFDNRRVNASVLKLNKSRAHRAKYEPFITIAAYLWLLL